MSTTDLASTIFDYTEFLISKAKVEVPQRLELLLELLENNGEVLLTPAHRKGNF
jgi:hypothetical protein